MAHAKYSPSSLEKLELCPCFQQDQTGDQTAATEGTLIHEAIAESNLDLCPDEFAEAVAQRCIDYRDSLITQLDASKANYTLHNEISVNVANLTRGTVDLLILVEGFIDPISSNFKGPIPYATIIDWKTGKFPVPPADQNIQLQAYALGVLFEHTSLTHVDAHLVCPRLGHVSQATYTQSDREHIEHRLRLIIDRGEDPNKQPTAYEDACRFCGVKSECPRMTDLVNDACKKLDLPVQFQPGTIVSPEDRAKAQVLAGIFEDWANQIRKANAKAVREDGIEIPGFELRSRAGNTSINETRIAAEALLALYPDLNSNEVLGCAKLSLPKLVEAIRAHTGDKKKEARTKLIAELSNVITQGDSITYLQRKTGITNEDIVG
jgi:CRISPR/Cas system-associated exonuclease Cas4 (RecB family)